ncbi:peptidoglycan recognition protein-like [Gigantopelta aegis]|uniref:peptidoglycan recognition protein-like n=1 Tax=Gigantopelta aegis TaxID=1735272 RepID=UPI001B8886C0|nr:peptidoglycan recognition protein-like [Gigantopelta aegis]
MIALPILLSIVALCFKLCSAANCGCATQPLHVRKGAGLHYGLEGTMAIGQCVTVHSDRHTANGYTWVHINYNGKSGYVAINWLSIHPCANSGHINTQLQLHGCPHITTRAEWGARHPAYTIGHMPGPAKYIFIHHSVTAPCTTPSACKAEVKQFQNYHMDGHKWPDIGYSFVIGEDGHVYEGRGWDTIGAHTYGYNSVGLGICIIGNYMERIPNNAALNKIKQLITCGVQNGKINSNYILRGHQDMPNNPTACPGKKLEDLIHTWPHF